MRLRHRPILPRLTTGLLALALTLVGACGNEGGEASPPPPEGQVVDLASLGFNEGDEATALYGVVEFADYGCVFCAEFHESSYPALFEEFVEPGDVLWKYIPITIGGFPNGRLAGLTGECGGMMGQFAAVRDRLYEGREEWMASDQAQALFVEYATSAGLDPDEFLACLTGDEAADRLDSNDATARSIGVTATPTFIIRGIPVRGAPPLADLQRALRELVLEVRQAEATAAPD